MSPYETVLSLLIKTAEQLQDEGRSEKTPTIPVGISNRHVHLNRKDLDDLFGAQYELTPIKPLSQPGQFACKETVTLCGGGGAIERVRVLGPVRGQTQVEILAGDSFKLGVRPEPRLSGDLDGTPGLTIIGPCGSVKIPRGVIIAQRHIHMRAEDAEAFGVCDGQDVAVVTEGVRGGIYRHVIIRVAEPSSLEFHVDIEEANAMGLTAASEVCMVKRACPENPSPARAGGSGLQWSLGF